jgi:hypothetical protein
MTHPTTAGAQAVITDERIEDIEGVIACLGDDAAQIRLELANCRPNKKGFICEEWAESMERAAELLADLLAASPAAATPQPTSDGASSTHNAIRACGGVVHSDGNIFFTHRYQFEHAASMVCGTATIATQPEAEKADAVDAPVKLVTSKWPEGKRDPRTNEHGDWLDKPQESQS